MGRRDMKLLSKNCFEKRKKTLLKKAHELKTLCDVDVGLIIYEGGGGGGDNSTKAAAAAEIWPSDDPQLIHQLIHSYHHTKDKEAKRGPTKRKQPTDLPCTSAANKKRKTEPPKYSVWDDRYDVLPVENLKRIEGFFEDKISNLKEMLKSKMAKARLEETQPFLELEKNSTGNIVSSESLLDQCGPVLTRDAKMMMMAMSSFQNNRGVMGFEQQGTITDVDLFGLPPVSSIGDSGMVLPTCYEKSNLYHYNYYNYSTMLCGGGGGGDCLSQGSFIVSGGDYLSQGGLIGGGSPTMMIREKRGLSLNVDYHNLFLGPVDYYSGPPPDLCY